MSTQVQTTDTKSDLPPWLRDDEDDSVIPVNVKTLPSTESMPSFQTAAMNILGKLEISPVVLTSGMLPEVIQAGTLTEEEKRKIEQNFPNRLRHSQARVCDALFSGYVLKCDTGTRRRFLFAELRGDVSEWSKEHHKKRIFARAQKIKNIIIGSIDPVS